MTDRKRPRESDEGQSVQRPRPGTLTAVLEYHRNIARATAVVRNAGADAVVARVLEVPTGVVLSLAAGTAAIDVDLDWPLVAGEYAGEVHGDTQVVTLGAHTSAPYSGMLRSPWAVLATEHIPVLGLGCAACHAALTTFGGAATLRALPSENWEELVDAWMCHGDQRLNASVVQGRADVEPSRTPAADEIWVGTLLLKVASTQLVGVACANTKAQGPWEVRTGASVDQQKASIGYPPWQRGGTASPRSVTLWLILRVLDCAFAIRRSAGAPPCCGHVGCETNAG